MKRKVDGEEVEVSAQEEAELLAEWAANELPAAIASKVSAIKKEGVARMGARIAGIYDLDVVNLTREFWLSIDPSARQPTVDFQYVIDVYQAGKDALEVIKALTDPVIVDAYDVVSAPSWPV